MVDINAPFEQYMQQCRDFVLHKIQTDPISALMFDDIRVLEIGWARRYWFHHNGV